MEENINPAQDPSSPTATVVQENPVAAPAAKGVLAPARHSFKTLWATGRRKTSIARVRMVPSKNSGKVTVNGLSVDDFFKGNVRQSQTAMEALKLVKGFSGYEFFIQVEGGGITGQAGAIRLGTARALASWDEKIKLQMRKEGYLTRDPRAVERKKSGQPKARKRFQYSKR